MSSQQLIQLAQPIQQEGYGEILQKIEEDIRFKSNFYGGNVAYHDFLELLIKEDDLDKWDNLYKCSYYFTAHLCKTKHDPHVFYSPMLCGERHYCYRDMTQYKNMRGVALYKTFDDLAKRFDGNLIHEGKLSMLRFTLNFPVRIRQVIEANDEVIDLHAKLLRKFGNVVVMRYLKVIGKLKGEDITAYPKLHLNHTRMPHLPFYHLEIVLPNLERRKGYYRVFEPYIDNDKDFTCLRTVLAETVNDWLIPQLLKKKLIADAAIEAVTVDEVDVKYQYYNFATQQAQIIQALAYIERQYMIDFHESLIDVDVEVKQINAWNKDETKFIENRPVGLVEYKDVPEPYPIGEVLHGCKRLLGFHHGKKLGGWFGWLSNTSRRTSYKELKLRFIPAWIFSQIVSKQLKKCPVCGNDLVKCRGGCITKFSLAEKPLTANLTYARAYYGFVLKNNLRAIMFTTCRFDQLPEQEYRGLEGVDSG